MARVARRGQSFERARSRFNITPGTPDAREIAKGIVDLTSAEELPGGDSKFLMPPSLWVWEHRAGAWSILYVFDEHHVDLISLRRAR